MYQYWRDILLKLILLKLDWTISVWAAYCFFFDCCPWGEFSTTSKCSFFFFFFWWKVLCCCNVKKRLHNDFGIRCLLFRFPPDQWLMCQEYFVLYLPFMSLEFTAVLWAQFVVYGSVKNVEGKKKKIYIVCFDLLESI